MNRTILLLCVLGLVPMCIVTSATADTLVIGRITYRDVEITTVTSDTISFQFYGHVVSKPLAEVQKVSLSQDAEFNKAEDRLAKGDTDQAIEHYEAAMKAAEKDWHKALIQYRMAAAKGGVAQAQTQPGATTQPGKGPPETAAAEGPLATPEAFGAFLEKRPVAAKLESPTGGQVTEAQRRAAEARYATQLTAWGNRVRSFRGKKVVWELAFQGFSKVEPESVREPPPRRPPTPVLPSPPRTTPRPPVAPEPTPPYPTPPRPTPRTAVNTQGAPAHWRVGYIAKAVAPGGVIVLANVLPLQGKDLDKIKENEIVRIIGHVRRDLEPGAPGKTLYLDTAVVEGTGKIADTKKPETPAKTPDTEKPPTPVKPPEKPTPPAEPEPPPVKIPKNLLPRF